MPLVRWRCACLLILAVIGIGANGARDEGPRTPEERALAFLACEVPRWSTENKCYSCHNNGDGARALYVAKHAGYALEGKSLSDTSRWLMDPDGWDHNGGEGPFSDKSLARLQFAATLRVAVESGLVPDRKPFERAAERLADDQAEDGCWPIEMPGVLGSPATYGRTLATAIARNTLSAADAKRHSARIARADTWLKHREVKSVLDASAVLISLEGSTTSAATARRRECLTILKTGQSDDGGWGPFVQSASEPFDTALAIVALKPLASDVEIRRMLHRGRGYLIATQTAAGNWPETTRPPGAESYAQRLSTTGWATVALILTRPERTTRR
jgi:hypothetical protein